MTLAVFSLLFLIPGDPVKMMLAEFATTPEQVARMRAQLHLDDPLPVQYGRFVGHALTGDLGTSIRSRRPVAQEIGENLGSTAVLATASMVVALVLGVSLGLPLHSWELVARRPRDARGAPPGVYSELLARSPADPRVLPAPRLVPGHRRGDLRLVMPA